MQPNFLRYKQIEILKQQHPELIIEDTIEYSIDELFDITYPSKKDTKSTKEVDGYSLTLTKDKPEEWGSWVYYPWLNKLLHIPPKEELRALRTSRNRNLVTTEEQAKLYDSTILVIGMSVGSNVAESLVASGIGSTLILVDMDIIEPSNLNRIRSPFHHVGLHKVDAMSRKIWEIDPYINIVQVKDGLNESNLAKILSENKVDVIADEMDDLRMKIILREAAKEHKLPVVMAADDGDDVLLDIERYDQKPDMLFFDGRIPSEILDKIKAGDIPRSELGIMIGRYFVGVDNIPLRMFKSLGEVGKTLPSWPQLGSAAALAGLTIAYSIKKILLGEKIREGRILVSLDEKIDLEHIDQRHQEELENYKNMMKGM